jgi:hypothetical protein
MQFFNENMHWKFLGFGCMYENKKKMFLKREINFKVFENFFLKMFWMFFEIFQRKSGILIPDLYFTV